ncbi:MAG: hypothetical protein DRI37_05735, partial [Chloroflexi bacterium]
GMGRRAWGAIPSTSPAPPAPPAAAAVPSREEEVAALKDMAGELREQLAEVMGRLDRLEKSA